MKRLDATQRGTVTLRVNGVERRGDASPRTLLSDFLRHTLGLTGTHVGCEHGVCGACTVLVDGVAQRACLTLAVQTEGRQVETVEGLAEDGRLNELQAAFRRHHALQCGYCTPGFLLVCRDYLRRVPRPSETQLREMLSGQLCRCTGYAPILRAILDVLGGDA